MQRPWTFHAPGRIVFGPGTASTLGQELTSLGLDRVFVVTDHTLVEAGLLRVVEDALVAAGRVFQVFAEGEPEPPLALAAACAEEAEDFGAECVLGLGGGSNMDLAKLAAAVLAHGGQPREYLGEDAIPGPVIPIIAVPTTAGTGSEASASAVFSDPAAGMKVAILSNRIRPRLAIVDPELTQSCPPHVTADSGMDALTHAIEALTAIDNDNFPADAKSLYQGKNPLSDAFAERAIRLVGQWLVMAVAEPDHRAAREGMAAAALLGGLAFSNSGVALAHAMEYPVGMAVHCSHGRGNGVLLPHVMRFNLQSRVAEFARIAQLLGRDTTGMTAERAADEALIAVDAIRGAIGIPARLSDLGVTGEMLPDFARKAFDVRRVLRVNPRAVSREDIEAIFTAAL